MSNQTAEPFCPIYREARETAPWKNAASAHAGLLFDKFANAWRYKQEHVSSGDLEIPEFDKGVGSKKEGANDWLNKFSRNVGCKNRLGEACARQRALVEKLGGNVICLTNIDRFVTGMGREHPLENGFVWHHTLGVPYLPGSSLKGMLRAWLREEHGDIAKDRRGNDRWTEPPELRRQFGTQGQAGGVILLDMLPTKPPKLSVDVMTPHYGPYYQDGEIPGDWLSPVPISFLTVAAEQSWQLAIMPAGGVRSLDEATLNTLTLNTLTLNTLTDALITAIEVCGAGAKTAVGYGRFRKDTAAEEQFVRQQAERREREEEARQRAAQDAEFEASLAGDSEPLQKLKKLKRDQNWSQSAGDQNMISALNEFAHQHPQPPQDCLDWIREWLESIPNYKGVWDQPDEKRGKKDKWKYPAAAVRDLVKKLNPPIL